MNRGVNRMPSSIVVGENRLDAHAIRASTLSHEMLAHGTSIALAIWASTNPPSRHRRQQVPFRNRVGNREANNSFEVPQFLSVHSYRGDPPFVVVRDSSARSALHSRSCAPRQLAHRQLCAGYMTLRQGACPGKLREPTMLMWSLRLTVCSIALLALIADIYGFLRFAPTIGLPRWAAVVCVMPIKAVEWSFLIFAHRLWASNSLGKS